jgi:hypothetical protein
MTKFLLPLAALAITGLVHGQSTQPKLVRSGEAPRAEVLPYRYHPPTKPARISTGTQGGPLLLLALSAILPRPAEENKDTYKQ